MRTLTNRLVPCLLVAGMAVLSLTEANAREIIDAQKGKTYRLTRKHGPWMVMVASFSEPPPERKGDGISPQQAADELVYELRTKGIPAYTFSQEDVVDQIQTKDARDPEKHHIGKYIALQGSVCVLAGNYEAPEDKIAVKTRNFIKKFHPEFLKEEEATAGGGLLHKLKNGGLYKVTPGRPGPLAGAFLTMNPMLSEDEIRSKKRDPLLLQLNSNDDTSLLTNKGKYTVVVASFYGRTETKLGNKVSDADLKELDTTIKDGHMDQSAESAFELARALRQAKSLGYERDYDAYVYHDRYGSIVTVGGFESADDPQITKLQNHFGAKVAAIQEDGSPSFGAEVFAVPRQPAAGGDRKTWLFDPYPRLMEVPSL